MRLENMKYLLEFDRKSGAILRILDKEADLDLLTEPRLADNFRLLLPLPDTEANYILGKEQRLTGADKNDNWITLRWEGPLDNPLGSWDIGVTMRVSFAGPAVEFRLDGDNRTQYRLAEAWYPILGGLKGLGDRQETRTMIPYMGWSCNSDMFQHFEGMVELGTQVHLPGVASRHSRDPAVRLPCRQQRHPVWLSALDRPCVLHGLHGSPIDEEALPVHTGGPPDKGGPQGDIAPG
ncbi:MAG: hypothetical protein HYY08_03555 [Firmicutes bacterium]|nr:hypothetical protein [Bacillota bacterium]